VLWSPVSSVILPSGDDGISVDAGAVPEHPTEGRRLEGGYLAATAGGFIGVWSGVAAGWALMSVVSFEGDPHLGMTNLAIGLAVMMWMLAGAALAGGLVGTWAGLRLTRHGGAERTVGAVLVIASGMTALMLAAELPGQVLAALVAAPAGGRRVVVWSAGRRLPTGP
jgi:hypothetical protein